MCARRWCSPSTVTPSLGAPQPCCAACPARSSWPATMYASWRARRRLIQGAPRAKACRPRAGHFPCRQDAGDAGDLRADRGGLPLQPARVPHGRVAAAARRGDRPRARLLPGAAHAPRPRRCAALRVYLLRGGALAHAPCLATPLGRAAAQPRGLRPSSAALLGSMPGCCAWWRSVPPCTLGACMHTPGACTEARPR